MLFKSRKKKIEKNFRKNWKKISALSFGIKIISVLVLFTLTPAGLVYADHETYKTNVKLDQNNPFVISLDNTLQLASGPSNVDSKILAKTTGQLASAKYGRAIERDGSYFQNIYKAAGAQFGVPWQLLQAVHYVETGCSDTGMKSSSAGAQGPMQFMPSTFRHYAVDGDSDGSTDINNVNDAIYSAANLLAASGAAEGNIDGALLNYNHSMSYVHKVKEVMSSVQ